jgi:hypothetical protein
MFSLPSCARGYCSLFFDFAFNLEIFVGLLIALYFGRRPQQYEP